ncbi:MAG: uroporphyrinogen-III C-methyltransferase, partial [Planctomycetota bacterium]|nr:uroporphyrinogen-III C-methyltransferase [Planctomycetota bacterium]
VYLVGAGPGDPGLITLRGVECLRAADVVLYDYLANSQLLRHCAPGTECICLGQHSRANMWSQASINAALVRYARQGCQVVRLKGGDPIVFGRLAEELSALREARIPYEIVPGITAALAVGSLTEVPLTQRDEASALAIVTGQEDPNKPDSLDYATLARFPGTLAVYMGVTTAAHWTAELMSAGKSPDTPCLVVRCCSWPQQRTIRCRLDEVVEQLEPRHKFPPPVLVLIGAVVAQAPETGWFASRPFMGMRILVTRPAKQMDGLADLLRVQGADVLEQPAIRIQPPPSWDDVDRQIDRLGDYDWVVWSSANGVEMFLNRLLQRGQDMRRLGKARLAVIGPGTAAALQRFGLRADLSPHEFRAEALADALQSQVTGRRVLLVRASRGREILCERLSGAGALVEQVVAYVSCDVTELDPSVRDAYEDGVVDWVTVTSSAIARSLHSLLGNRLHHSKIASLSPVSSATLRELGYEPTVEASIYTMAGLVAAVADYLALQNRQ